MDPAPAEPTAVSTATKSMRAALVFVPGISRSWGERSLHDMADDMVVSLSKLSRSYTFAATASDSFQYGFGSSPRTARVVTITRAPSGESVAAPSVDLYELDYVRKLTADQESKPIFVRALFVAWAFVRGVVQVVARFRRPGKTGRERVQLLLFLFVLALYAILLLTLLASILQLGLEAFNTARATVEGNALPTPTPATTPAPTPTAPPAAAPADRGALAAVLTPLGQIFAPAAAAVGWFYDTILRAASIIAVFVWLVLPPKHKFKEAITNGATDYLAVDYYLRAGAGSQQLSGDVANLLDAIRRPDLDYQRIDVASYSLGSIVAFNAMFPAGAPPNPAGPIADVRTLVTIGCPFDLVRAVRPDYFTGRRQLVGAPKQWLNVYTPNDILGSNFRNDDLAEQPEPEVIANAIGAGPSGDDPPLQPVNLAYHPGGVPPGSGFLDILVFSGFRAHAQYWDAGTSGEETCFDEIITRLYPDHLLAEPAAPAPA